SAWLGGLIFVCVAVLPRRDAAELASVVPRFSLLALVCVVAIISAGTVLSWQLLGSFAALFTTAFGHVLLVKLAALAAVLVAARSSKRWVERRLDIAYLSRGQVGTVTPFMYSVVIEAALAVVVLGAASVLVATNPAH